MIPAHRAYRWQSDEVGYGEENESQREQSEDFFHSVATTGNHPEELITRP